MSKVKVVLADDHALLRAGLAVLINSQPDLEVVAQAATAEEAIESVLRTQPELLVLDLSMPGGNSIQAIETLRQKCPHTRILVLTMHDDPGYLHATMSAGCAGYLVKTASDAEMLSALRTVAQGRTVIGLSLSQGDARSVLKPANKTEDHGRTPLSDREREVLQLLARGHTNSQIAELLFLSVKTVETYRSRIGEKLRLRGRSELVAYAMKIGLLSKDGIE
jgi:two-component system, NarL family, response regulator NreC